MKKFLSSLLSAVIIVFATVVGFTPAAAEANKTDASNDINGFIDGITKLVQEYDESKEFTTPENDEPMQIQSFFAENTTDETSNNAEQEYILHDFQTARLIVCANGKFNQYGALEDVSGFEDFHILQYESPETAMLAFKQLQSEKT